MQLEGHQLTEESIDLLGKSTRGNTKTKYSCIEKKWLRYCANNKLSTEATTNSLINFMASEFNRKLSYNYIKGYLAPLKDYTKNVDLDMVRKLKKGMFNERPPKSKYCVIWDVNIVLTFLSAMRTDTLMYHSQKVATLLMLLSGNRVNMLTHMKWTLMNMTDGEVTFLFEDPLKHYIEGSTGSSRKADIMTYRAYPDTSLCPVNAIKTYIEQRGELCIDDALFVTTTKPHRAASHDTLARWIKDTLCCSGIDTGTYQAHSCRAAATSGAALAGISLKTILKSASWANASTFYKFYKKELDHLYDPPEENFGTALLDQYTASVSYTHLTLPTKA